MAEEQKKEKGLPSKLDKIAKEIESLTVVELSELANYLEDKFGVTPMAAAVAAPAQGGVSQASEAKEEKSTFNVVLADMGANKLAVIKTVRELKPDLGLMDAKKLVESAPKEILTGVKKDAAEEAKKKLESAGAKVELK